MRLEVMNHSEIGLLIRLGILDERADEGTAFIMLGKVIRDSVVRQRSRELDPTVDREPYGSLHEVVNAMSPPEKVALRERVFEACRTPRRA